MEKIQVDNNGRFLILRPLPSFYQPGGLNKREASPHKKIKISGGGLDFFTRVDEETNQNIHVNLGEGRRDIDI